MPCWVNAKRQKRYLNNIKEYQFLDLNFQDTNVIKRRLALEDDIRGMNLFSKIENDLKSAYLEKRAEEVDTLRLLRAAIKNLEIDLRVKQKEVDDEAILEIIAREAKKRREAIELYEKGNRPELAEKEKKELALLLGYLPQQLSDEDIKAKLEELIKSNNAQDISDLGKMMGLAMKELKGKADGKRIQDILKDVLSKISNS